MKTSQYRKQECKPTATLNVKQVKLLGIFSWYLLLPSFLRRSTADAENKVSSAVIPELKDKGPGPRQPGTL